MFTWRGLLIKCQVIVKRSVEWTAACTFLLFSEQKVDIHIGRKSNIKSPPPVYVGSPIPQHQLALFQESPRPFFRSASQSCPPCGWRFCCCCAGISKPTQDPPNQNQLKTPPTKNKIWTCSICTKTITRNQISFQCHNTNHWVHKKCSKITEKDYHIDWTCSLHSCNQCNITAIQPSINQHSSTLANSNFSQQFTTGQPTTSTQVTYHSKVKELENKRSKTTAKSKSESTHMKQIWSCSICNKTITHNQISFLCHRSLTNFSDTDHWVHKKSANITERNHHDTWTCQLHSNNQNNMTSNQSTLNQQSSTLTSSNINQQFTTGQPTTSTQVKYTKLQNQQQT